VTVLAGKPPRRPAASLVGTLRPGRKDSQPGRRCSARRRHCEAQALLFHAPRSSPPAGGGSDAGARGVTEASLSAPARRRSPRRPSKSRGCASAVSGPSYSSPSHRFRERRAWMTSLPETRGPPRGPAGNAAGPGRFRSPLLTFARLHSSRSTCPPNGQHQPRRETPAERRRLHAVLGAHSNLNS